MLNMNQYGKLTDLFKFGFNLDFGSLSFNRYQGGQIRMKLAFLSILSAGTGHWPFQVFDLNYINGQQSAWQVTVLGLTVGSRKVHDIAEDGSIAGPDKREMYSFFSCLNHKGKTLEEIIYAD